MDDYYKRWQVVVNEQRNGTVRIQLIAIPLIFCVEYMPWDVEVKPPGRLEKLLGVTFESKIRKVHNKAQRIANKRNAKLVRQQAELTDDTRTEFNIQKYRRIERG